MQVEVETMTKTGRFRYAQDAGVQILELPYTGERVAMILLLPDEINGLKRLEDALTPERFAGWIAGARMQEVELFLPRLDIVYSLSLANTLQAMGMKDAFGRADFSGIAEGPLVISDVMHKAVIKSNEEGSEAAAATAVVMSRGPREWTPPLVFRVDRPFLLLIRENSTGSILFIGRVTDPTPSAA